jgi:hypothetical protein
MWCGEGAKAWNTPTVIRAVTERSAKQASGNILRASMVVEPAVPISQAKSPPLIRFCWINIHTGIPPPVLERPCRAPQDGDIHLDPGPSGTDGPPGRKKKP